MKKIITFTLFSLLFIPSFLSAQVTAKLIMDPKNPDPYSLVTLRLENFSFNVETALVTWKVNGKVLVSEQGKSSVSLKTGGVGETIDVSVTAETLSGFSVTQQISITPSSVSIMYEAPKSYTPLLYEGKTLPSVGGLVKVVAIPSISDKGVPVPASSMSFSWYSNDTLLKNSSGFGKQSAIIPLDYLTKSTSIKVIARSPLGNTGEKTINIYPHQIMPLLYNYDQVLGSDLSFLIGRRYEAIGDFVLSLEPFYASYDDKKSFSSVWYLDGIQSTPLGGRILAFHPKENSYGTKNLKIETVGINKNLQKGQVSTELIFDTRK